MEITGLAAWIETSSDASSTTRPRMIKRLLARRLRGRSTNGTRTLFQNGETVYLTDTGIFSGVVKVRKRGETTEYWTNMEAIP